MKLLKFTEDWRGKEEHFIWINPKYISSASSDTNNDTIIRIVGGAYKGHDFFVKETKEEVNKMIEKENNKKC